MEASNIATPSFATKVIGVLDVISTALKSVIYLHDKDWRNASRSTLELIAGMNANTRESQKARYECCIMAADLVFNHAPPVRVKQQFEANLHPLTFESVHTDAFKAAFATYTPEAAEFRALRYAYVDWLQMPPDECETQGKTLLPRMIRLLAECGMFKEANQYGYAWVDRLQYHKLHKTALAAEHAVLDIFICAGAYEYAAKRVFVSTYDGRYMYSINRLSATTGTQESQLHVWNLALLAMATPGANVAYEQLRYVIANSWVNKVSKLVEEVAPCRHEVTYTFESRLFVYTTNKLLNLWIALLVKRDRAAVTKLMHNFLSKDDMTPFLVCDDCHQSTEGYELLKPYVLFNETLIDALFARPPEVIVKWLEDNGVVLSKLISEVTTDTVKSLDENGHNDSCNNECEVTTLPSDELECSEESVNPLLGVGPSQIVADLSSPVSCEQVASQTSPVDRFVKMTTEQCSDGLADAGKPSIVADVNTVDTNKKSLSIGSLSSNVNGATADVAPSFEHSFASNAFIKTKTTWMGALIHAKDDDIPIPFLLTIHSVIMGAVEGVMRWPTMNDARVKIRGVALGEEFHFAEYKYDSDKQEVVTRYVAKMKNKNVFVGATDKAASFSARLTPSIVLDE